MNPEATIEEVTEGICPACREVLGSTWHCDRCMQEAIEGNYEDAMNAIDDRFAGILIS